MVRIYCPRSLCCVNVAASVRHGFPLCLPARPGNPRPGESGPRFPIPGRIGNRGFPVSRPNRESGIPSPIQVPGKKSGNRGNRESDFLSDEYQLQWTRNILSREYHASAFTGSMRLLFRVRDSEREHAAVSDEHQLHCYCSELRIHSAASFML